MKALITSFLFSVLLAATINATAQSPYSIMTSTKEESTLYFKTLKQEAQKAKSNKIKAEKVFVPNKKTGKYELVRVDEYNTDGYMMNVKVLGKKDGIAVIEQYTYDTKNNVTSFSYVRKGKTLSKENWAYDDKDNLKTVYYFGKNEKAAGRGEYTYDASNNNTSFTKYNKKGHIIYRYEFDYYPDGSHKETRHYDMKGKRIGLYQYTCGEVGKTAKEISKDTSNMCIKYSTDADGNTVKTVESIEKKKHGWTTITKYDKRNNEVGYEYKNPKGKSLIKNAFKFNDDNNMTQAVFYNKKGTIDSQYDYTYDASGKVKNCVQAHPGKKTYTINYEYETF